MDIRALLKQSITVASNTGASAYGPIYGSPVTYAARVEYGDMLVRGNEGDTDQIATARVFLAPDAVIHSGDKVTYGSDTFTVMDVMPQYGIYGLSHLEVTLK